MHKIQSYFEKGQVIVCDYYTQRTARLGPNCEKQIQIKSSNPT